MLRSRYLTLLVLAAVIGAVGDAAALKPHVRDGWILDLAFGYSDGEAEFVDPLIVGEFELPGGKQSTEDGASTHIGLGHMVGEHFALGASYTTFMYEDGEVPDKFHFSLQNIMASATWYPGKPDNALGGFYVRGSAGLAWATINEIELEEGEEQGEGTRYMDTGLGLELHVGYEFRVFSMLGVGLATGVNYQTLDGDYYKTAGYVPLLFNLAWYWGN